MKAFFIVGVQRSGTTMLSVMLGNHPDILMEDKVKIFRVIGSLQNMYDLKPYNVGLTDKDFWEWMIQNDKTGRTEELVNAEEIDDSSNYRTLINASISKKLVGEGKQVWGDKAPNLQHYLAELLMLIPNAKILHIVRDGRATAASMSKRTFRNLKVSAHMWVEGNTCGLVNQEVLGNDQYKIIRFEDLIAKPEAEMKEVCTFLDIAYHPAIINLSNDTQGSEKYVKQFFDRSKIDSWKSNLDHKSISKIEAIQGPTLEKFGYEVGAYNYKPLSVRRKLWLMQFDNWGNLFRGRKKGMKDKVIIEYRDPFGKRLRRFFMHFANLVFSKEITRSLFSKYHYKEKTKNKSERNP